MSSEHEILLRALLPNISALLLITALVGSAVLADLDCREDHPADRHRVLKLAVLCSLGVIVLGLMFRLLVPESWMGDLLSAPWLLIGLAGAWIVGSVGFALRFAIGALSVRSLIRGGRMTTRDDLSIRIAAQRAAVRLGLEQPPRIVLSSACRSPFVFGVLRPVVMLPASLENASVRDLQLILTHEFAHVRRGDCATELATQLLGTLCWWNPVFWATMSRLRATREEACDRAVISGLDCRIDYARLLVRFASNALLPISHAFAHVRMADRATLNARLGLVLDDDQTAFCVTRFAMSYRSTALATATIALVALTLDAAGVVVAYDIIDSMEESLRSAEPVLELPKIRD